VTFSFGKCQQPVNREMTESCSRELIGYRMPRARAKWLHSLIQQASINKTASGFFDILIGCQDILVQS